MYNQNSGKGQGYLSSGLRWTGTTIALLPALVGCGVNEQFVRDYVNSQINESGKNFRRSQSDLENRVRKQEESPKGPVLMITKEDHPKLFGGLLYRIIPTIDPTNPSSEQRGVAEYLTNALLVQPTGEDRYNVALLWDNGNKKLDLGVGLPEIDTNSDKIFTYVGPNGEKIDAFKLHIGELPTDVRRMLINVLTAPKK